ncbi:MAG: FAD-binding oxidoreductase [Burkholderiaceae bacterium]|nr:FAD-binding oxidoreductase [Burkholderiaceae bacterium]
MTAAADVDTLVIGGGLVGLCVAYGLARAGQRVRVLDEGDVAFRAARGNFGLVWVQGKGRDRPDYARWTMASARQWPAFAAELAQRTGVDVALAQPGGLTLCLDDAELAERAAGLRRLRDDLGADYPFDVLDPAQVRALSPHVGAQVCGAIYCPLDGHVSPLRLLRALVQAFESLGGELCTDTRVDELIYRDNGFHVRCGPRWQAASRVVLAAGLGNRRLAPAVGLRAPVQPNRGQILVTERLQPFLRHPTMQVRQTEDGVVQIGDSMEDVGFDDRTSLAQLARIADRAVRCFPLLTDVNIVRTWGALRVMSPDGFPVYQASMQCPGAFVVTCHSGVTLAAQHASVLADWIIGGREPPHMAGFKAERFDVQAA